MTPRSKREAALAGKTKSGRIPCIQLDYRDHRDRLRPYGRVERLVVVRFGAHRPELVGRPQQRPADGTVPRARLPGPGQRRVTARAVPISSGKTASTSKGSGAGGRGQGGAGVGGQLRPRAEIAVRGVLVGEGDVVGIGVGPHRVEQGNGLEDLAGGEAGEVLPDEDAGGEHRFAAQHGVTALPADEDDRKLSGWFVPQITEVLERPPVNCF